MDTNTLRHRRTKRTTVTLEADVADFIRETLSNNKGLKEKQLINKLLRSGMKIERAPTKVDFQIQGFKSQLINDLAGDDLEKMLDEI